MYVPEIRFSTPEFDGAESTLGTFTYKLPRILNEISQAALGNDALLNPSDIQITPIAIQSEKMIIVRSWHETAAPSGMVGVLQPREAVFELVADETDAYLRDRTEGGVNFQLTTVETLALHGLVKLAEEHESISSQVGRETA